MAVILLIPVVAVSIVLIKFFRKALITINVQSSKVEFSTFYEKFSSDLSQLSLKGKKLAVSEREFFINPSRAGRLKEVIENKNE